MSTENLYMHVHHVAAGGGGGGAPGHTVSASNVSHGNNGAAFGATLVGVDPAEAVDDNPLSVMVRAQNRIDTLEGQLDEQRLIVKSLTQQLEIVKNFFSIFKVLNAPNYSSSQTPDMMSQFNPGSPWAPTNIKSDLSAMIVKLSREDSFFPDEA